MLQIQNKKSAKVFPNNNNNVFNCFSEESTESWRNRGRSFQSQGQVSPSFKMSLGPSEGSGLKTSQSTLRSMAQQVIEILGDLTVHIKYLILKLKYAENSQNMFLSYYINNKIENRNPLITFLACSPAASRHECSQSTSWNHTSFLKSLVSKYLPS